MLTSPIQPVLPGVRFQVAAPQPQEVLPRMDITAFCGIAAAGPIGVPEAVEDFESFRAVFGADVELATDSETGRVVYSQLGQSVEAFLHNGGRRCWVLRLDWEPSQRFEKIEFLDPALENLGVESLLREASHRLFVLEEPLRGFYALLPIEEVTMVALPDLTHRPWREVTVVEKAELEGTRITEQDGQVCWDDVEHAEEYEVEEARDPEFSVTIRNLRQKDACLDIVRPEGCDDVSYYRVRALRTGLRNGPWSGALIVLHPVGDFHPCDSDLLLESPLAEVAPDDEGGLTHILIWEEVAGADDYEVQSASEENFDPLNTSVVIDALDYDLGETVQRTRYLRVRARRGLGDERAVGPWSNVVIVDPPPVAEGRELDSVAAYDRQLLRNVHAALARFCAARGDMLAILSLPLHFESEDAEEYQDDLKRELREVDSYCALYHPWLRVQSEDPDISEVRLLPPDGAVAGLYARRARERGAWIAPANDSLQAVVGLHPKIGRDDWETLFAEQVNLVRPDPRGFVLLSAFTLSQEQPLHQVNVRRLMILLRRLVLREGNRLVFQPHSFQLRARISDQFTRLLEDLYQRGAFAGSRPAEAFRVRTDESVNPIESVERGRLIVEIQVAPARPLQFLTVRLIQEGLESLTIDES